MGRNGKDGLVSIIIPTRNEGEMLHMTIESILDTTSGDDFEVIVVDDGSTDGSCTRYSRPGSGVRVVTTSGVGVPRARNLGADHALGEVLVFLDAHCRVSPNAFDLLRRGLEAPGVAVMGPTFTRLEQPEPKGCGMKWRNHRLETVWFRPQSSQRPYAVPFTPGGCQAFRQSVFNAIGRFDEGFGQWGFQDIEICLRAWLLGYRVMVTANAVVAHHFRDARGFEVADETVVYSFLRLIHLHFSPSRIRRCLRAISPYPGLEQAMDTLYETDIFEVRAAVQFRRRFDDDWFFEVFHPELNGEEPAEPLHDGRGRARRAARRNLTT